jgi:hypothetical protein
MSAIKGALPLAEENRAGFVAVIAGLVTRLFIATRDHVAAFAGAVSELSERDKAVESDLRKLYRQSAGRE